MGSLQSQDLQFILSTRSGGNQMRAYKFRIYKDNWKQWRWRLVAGNGKIVADSAEGYRNRRDIRRMIEKIMSEVEIAEVEFVDA